VVFPKDTPLKADKGYSSKKNTEILKKCSVKNHILKKALKKKPFTKWETRCNTFIGKTGFKVALTL
jgi:IS5 family transposase